MRKFHAALIIVLLFSLLSCKLVDQAFTPATQSTPESLIPPPVAAMATATILPTTAIPVVPPPTIVPPLETPVVDISQYFISPITFCEEVSDDGYPKNPATEFPAGTSEVWAYFTYEGMADGISWGRLWELDGEVYLDAQGETWEDGPEGWVAYAIISSDSTPLSGEYSLTIDIEGVAVQQASFSVAKSTSSDTGGFPAFGPVQFAHDVTESNTPIDPAVEFEDGIREVYAIFPFINMEQGQTWKRVWLQDGEVVAESSDLQWDETIDGVTYSSLSSDEGLSGGEYSLNLYIDDQLVRSANFFIIGTLPTAQPPATPEELIDADLRPAWDMLYYAVDEYNFLHDVAQFALDHRISIRMDESYSGSTMAVYRYDGDSCQPGYSPGEVIVYRQTWNESSWQELAGILAHELTHAMQHYDGDYRCPGCSVYKEYHAFIAEYYTYMMLDRTDLIPDAMYGDDGYFDSDILWDVIKEAYGDECPDY